MKLNEKGLFNKKVWEDAGFVLPKFDRAKMIANTKANPQWIHFGAGNIFRAFLANAAQTMLNGGYMDTGIVVVEGFDYEIVEKKYRPNDNYSVLVTLKADGSVEKTVVGSVASSHILDSENAAEFQGLQEIFKNASLQLATFTITEKGYSLTDAKGELLDVVKEDFASGPTDPKSYMGKVAALLYERFLAGGHPIAMVSADNCSHNGDKLFAAMECFACEWVKNGMADTGFVNYVRDRQKISFPWTMIDKITPRPDESVEDILRRDGLEDLDPVITAKNTYVAPFVNAEETEYFVIEDAFPNGRPALEKAGFIFTDRETVDKVERMKVCTCLNPLHTALAIFGCLLGFEKISEEMKDEDLVKLVKQIGYKEGLPVVVDPGVLNPKEFIDTVIDVRLPNPFMPDTPQRIATDTSQKLAIRFGETIKNYKKQGRNPDDLILIPLVFAGWIRYLTGVDDNGRAFALSPDPLLERVKEEISGMKPGDVVKAESLHSLLSDESIFGVNLFEYGLANRVIDGLNELNAGKGAVRSTLKKYVSGEGIV